MEGMVAKWYASTTAKSMDEVTRLARRIACELAPGSAVLEVAPGPGYFAIELAKLGPYSITGLDISRTFVEMARRRAAEAGVQVEFRQGNASALPFDNDRFDFLLCRAAFKNFAQPVDALREMRRVLKPGGRALIIDLRRDASRQALDDAVNGMGLNAVNRIMTKMTFRFMLLKSAYSKEHFEHMGAEAGFSALDVQVVDIGLEVTLRK